MSYYVHPTAIIGEDVEIGDDVYIGPFCYITGETKIGNNNRFEAHCSIGTNPEHKEYFDKQGKLFIGNNNVFREFVTVNAGTKDTTYVLDNCTLLRGSHVGHDSVIFGNVTLSCNVLIGGHSIILDGVNMGLGSICHQYSVLGSYSMIGMGGIVTKKSEIRPGKIYAGNPVIYLKDNTIGLERNKITPDKLLELNKSYEDIISMLKH